MQKFRLDYEGNRSLRMDTETKMEFKVPRYGDLIGDTYLVVNIPDIYSPIYRIEVDGENVYAEYQFRWVEELGTTLIKEISVEAGGHTLAKYSGEYLAAAMKRDVSQDKREVWKAVFRRGI